MISKKYKMVCAKFHKIRFALGSKRLLKGKTYFDKKLNTFLLGENVKMRKDMIFFGYELYSF